MQLTPWYGDDPLITLDGPPSAIVEPVLRQRRRFAEVLGELDADQWAAPTRCEGWSVRDVVVHLESTNTFWGFSIGSGLAGNPSTFLATFDPVAGPAGLVAASDLDHDEVLSRLVTGGERLEALVRSLDDEGLSTLAEAPPGHLPVAAVLHHALWDSWVHERDVLLPLGIDPVVEPDEVLAVLRYAASLGPALDVSRHQAHDALLAVSARDPEGAVAVEVTGDQVRVRAGSSTDLEGADLVLSGDAVSLAEALSRRLPLDADIPPESAWMVAGLAEVFDQAP